MNMLRIMLILIGVAMFIWFAIPAVFLNILNSGNVVGVIVSALLIAYGVEMSRINLWIAGIWQSLCGKVILGALAFMVISAIVFFVVVTAKIIISSNNRPTEETTVVVLGCQVHEWGPSLMLEQRLIAAKEYLEENPEIKCIVSGGQGDNEPVSEAECMYEWLKENGIDSNRIYIEDKSTSTRENLEFSREIIEREGLKPKITIVTNSFHQYRAGRIAKDIGFESYSVSGKTFKTMLPTYYVREVGGVLYEMIVEGN